VGEDHAIEGALLGGGAKAKCHQALAPTTPPWRKRELSPKASTRVDTEAEPVRENLAEIPTPETLALVTAGVNVG